MSIEENNETLKNDNKNDILEEVEDIITRDFKEQTEEMRKHMKKLKDEMKTWETDQCDQN